MIIDGKERGWICKYAFEENAIAADDFGQKAIANKAFLPQMFADSVITRAKEIFLNIEAAEANHVRNNEDLSAAIPITFTIDAQPDVPRTITWSLTHANITAFTLTIIGVNARGNSVTETFTQASGWSGETSNAFATITSITLSARTGTGAGDTCDIGTGSKLGLANAISATSAVYKVTKNKADYAAANYTVDATYSLVDVSTGGAIIADDNFTISYKTLLNLA